VGAHAIRHVTTITVADHVDFIARLPKCVEQVLSISVAAMMVNVLNRNRGRFVMAMTCPLPVELPRPHVMDAPRGKMRR
jgi:hypothetical protein